MRSHLDSRFSILKSEIAPFPILASGIRHLASSFLRFPKCPFSATREFMVLPLSDTVMGVEASYACPILLISPLPPSSNLAMHIELP
jgi:hypothetical protein